MPDTQHLIELVKTMRMYQCLFFADRSPSALAMAKKYEQQVDIELRKYPSSTIQAELFL